MAYAFNTKKAAALLRSADTFSFVLLAIVLDRYTDDNGDFPDDLVDYPELLFKNIEEDFSIRLPQENEDKLNAALTVMTTDLFYTNWNVFNHVAQTFCSGDPGDLDDDNEMDACKCMWSIVEAGLITDTPLERAGDRFAKDVIDKINDVVDNEAEDKEEQYEDIDAEEMDTMEEALAENYYQRYLTCNMLELGKQLLRLGARTSDVSEMLGSFGRSLDAIEERVED